MTAFFQKRYSLSTSARSIWGSHCLSLPQLARRSSTSLGAAYAAGLATGFWSEVEDLRANWGKDKEWESQMDRAEIDKEYRFWKKAVTRTFDWVE